MIINRVIPIIPVNPDKSKCACIGPQGDEKLCPCDLANERKKRLREAKNEAQ